MITDWMFGLSFQIYNNVHDKKLDGSISMNTPQVRIYCLYKTATTSSHPHTDLELKHSTVYIFQFLHFCCTAPTVQSPAGCIWPPPDACQPRGRVVTCDVVGTQGGRNSVLPCW